MTFSVPAGPGPPPQSSPRALLLLRALALSATLASVLAFLNAPSGAFVGISLISDAFRSQKHTVGDHAFMPPESMPGATQCATEKATCECDGPVAFGSSAKFSSGQFQEAKWAEKAVRGSIACTAVAFGEDPLPGKHKSCWCGGVAAAAGALTSVASAPVVGAPAAAALKHFVTQQALEALLADADTDGTQGSKEERRGTVARVATAGAVEVGSVEWVRLHPSWKPSPGWKPSPLTPLVDDEQEGSEVTTDGTMVVKQRGALFKMVRAEPTALVQTTPAAQKEEVFQETPGQSGPTGRPHAVQYTKAQAAYLNEDRTGWQAISFIVDESGGMTRRFMTDAVASGSCTAFSKTGKSITGKLAFDESNGDSFLEKGFGTHMLFVDTKCAFDEPVDARRLGRVQFGEKAGYSEVNLRHLFEGKAEGLAICHPAVFGDYEVDKVFAVWTAFFNKQVSTGDKPVRFYSFDVRGEARKKTCPLDGSIDVKLPFGIDFGGNRPGRDEKAEKAGSSSQPFYLAQFAWVKECHQMAKYDGYKWAGFMDNDELPTLMSGQNLLGYLDARPDDVQAVLVQRKEVLGFRTMQTYAQLWSAAPSQISLQQSIWDETRDVSGGLSQVSQNGRNSPLLEKHSLKVEPPKYFRRLDKGFPGGKVHEACALRDIGCLQHTYRPPPTEILIRHMPIVREFDLRLLDRLANGQSIDAATLLSLGISVTQHKTFLVPDTAGPDAALCAAEGELCPCNGQVIYGGGDNRAEHGYSAAKLVSGTIKCNSASFGGDPMVGKKKTCWCSPAVSGQVPAPSMASQGKADSVRPQSIVPTARSMVPMTGRYPSNPGEVAAAKSNAAAGSSSDALSVADHHVTKMIDVEKRRRPAADPMQFGPQYWAKFVEASK